jgi:hypothetical protein
MTQTFTQTSKKLYDRHSYLLVLEDGGKRKFDDYIQLRDYWMFHKGNGMSHVEVIDNKPKGF